MTTWHYVGTCTMGPDLAEGAVVDGQLRVHNISGLRVVDASVMPRVVGGNTNAATIMIAEKAFDLIKDTWRKIDSASPEQIVKPADVNQEKEEL